MVANTFAIPSASRSFTLSLVDFNNSILSSWSNFYGPAVPTSAEITVQGTASAPYEGSMYRSSIMRALYVYDPNSVKGGGIGGNYTRVGIGNRNFESIATLVSNISYIEQSEIVTTVGDSTANYRAYVKTNNSNGFVDIGIPPSSSLLTAMFVNRQISNTFLVASTITQHELAPNILYSSDLDINGRLRVKSAVENISNISISSGTLTVDLYNASTFLVNLTSNITTFTVNNANSAYASGFMIYFTGDGTQRGITWPATVLWPSAVAPTMTSTAGKVDAIGFTCPRNDGKFFAFLGGLNM